MTLSEQEHGVSQDLSALAWVSDELRRTLENAHKALRRQQRELEAAPGAALEGPAGASLQQARVQFHQGAGALEMVGESEGARVLRASEQAILRFVQRPQLFTGDAVQSIERASFALLDFLRRRLAGKAVSPLALFPQYREVQTLARAAAGGAPALAADADTRGRMEQCMLALLRGPVGPAATQMSQLFAGLAAGTSGKLSGLWSVAAAFFEAQ